MRDSQGGQVKTDYDPDEDLTDDELAGIWNSASPVEIVYSPQPTSGTQGFLITTELQPVSTGNAHVVVTMEDVASAA